MKGYSKYLMDPLKYEIINEDMKDIYSRKVDWDILYGSRILISGATGMIASYMVYYLIYLNEFHNADITIFVQARSKEKAEKRFGEHIHKNYFHILQFDLDKEIIFDFGVDYIIHAASYADPNRFATNPVEVIVPNAVGTYQLLNLATRYKIKGFLLFSSGDVYGKVERLGYKEVTENEMGVIDPLANHSCYNESKRLAETLCKAFFSEYNVPTRIVRIGHTYAPTMDINNDPRVFSSFMKCVVNRDDIVMLSDGSGKRPFCYITDAVAGMYKVLLNGKSGEAYNLINSEAYISIRDLGEILCTIEPENKIKLVCKKRERLEKYSENNSITEVTISNDKIKELGVEFKIGPKAGFTRVLKHIRDLRLKGDLC